MEVDNNQTLDCRPEGLTKKQDIIMNHVADFMTRSCNRTVYYHKLCEKTRDNSNFDFLKKSHLFYSYFEILLRNYERMNEVRKLEKGMSVNAPTDYQLESHFVDGLSNPYPYGHGNVVDISHTYPHASLGSSLGHHHARQVNTASNNSNYYDKQEAEEDDDDDEYELIIEDGKKKYVPKKHQR